MSQTVLHTSPSASSDTSRTLLGRNIPQMTLRQVIHCRGTGLHSGKNIRLTLSPAPANTGIAFQRTDNRKTPLFPIGHKNVIRTHLSTVISPSTPSPSKSSSPTDDRVSPIGREDDSIATIEHLMAALHATGIDNVIISVDGPEIPALDGCSRDFLFLLHMAGLQPLKAVRRQIEILRPVEVQDDQGGWARFSPSRKAQLSFDVMIDFPDCLIGQQRCQTRLNAETFQRDIASARTFIPLEAIENLRNQGLAKGGSLKNVIVVDDDHVLNPEGLRFSDEFVRHKLLDAVGDLYCAGHSFIGHFESYKSGHRLNNHLLHKIFEKAANWRLVAARYDLTRIMPSLAA